MGFFDCLVTLFSYVIPPPVALQPFEFVLGFLHDRCPFFSVLYFHSPSLYPHTPQVIGYSVDSRNILGLDCGRLDYGEM
jgi:hypothetical protein